MKKAANLLVIIFSVVLIGCEDLTKNNNDEPYDGPKTIFGESVKKTKDLSKSLSAQDEAVKHQIEEMDD